MTSCRILKDLPEKTKPILFDGFCFMAEQEGFVYVFACGKIDVLPSSSWRQTIRHRCVVLNHSNPILDKKITRNRTVACYFLWRSRRDLN